MDSTLFEHTSSSVQCNKEVGIPYFFNETPWLLFIFCAATIQGWCLFLWKAWRRQLQLDKVDGDSCYVDAVSSTHSLSLLLSAVGETCTCNTNGPSTSMVTVVRNPSYM